MNGAGINDAWQSGLRRRYKGGETPRRRAFEFDSVFSPPLCAWPTVRGQGVVKSFEKKKKKEDALKRTSLCRLPSDLA